MIPVPTATFNDHRAFGCFAMAAGCAGGSA